MTAVSVASAAVGMIGLIAFVYPYLIYPITLLLFRSRRIQLGPALVNTTGRGYALFFCAYNEAEKMSAKFANLRALKARYPEVEIYAYDDASNDDTLNLLQTEPSLTGVVEGSGRSGKAHGMKRMVSECDAEFLIFTDANVALDLECIAQLDRYYSDKNVGGVCGSLKYVPSGLGTATEATGGLYWRLEEWAKDLESRCGNVMGADGSIFSVRRTIYPEFPDTVQDDFTVSMSVVFAGLRLVKAPGVVAYEQLVSDQSDEARRKMRIASRAFHTHTVLRPGLRRMSAVDRYKYFAHKQLRWWGALSLMISSIGFLVFLVALGEVGLTVLAGFALLGFVLRVAMPGVVAFVWDLLVAVMATFRGVLRARRGETVAVWTPPSTR